MFRPQLWVVLLSIFLFHLSPNASAYLESLDDTTVKSSVYLSPPFFLRPGSVIEKYYFGIPFPKGHIALKSFDAEVVDENGTPAPLHETYLHHWFVVPYYGQKEEAVPRQFDAGEVDFSKIIMKRNAGVCKGTLTQYYGLGSETRKTSTWIPGTYGIEIGKSEDFPDGYEEKWMLNVHAIDTRGAEDRLGCAECKCSLYNVTTDTKGHPLEKDYIGGFHCCYDQAQCQVKQGFNGAERKLYLRYTVRWVDWDESIVPVKIYILDVTDSKGVNDSANGNIPTCKVEYVVKPCSLEGSGNGECVDVKKTEVALPHGGDIVYGVAHQHTGGLGSALYGQDGRLLCTSTPTYGEGKEAGNEAGYIVGMSSCYPEPGSVRVADGEVLTVISNYSSSRQHIGVMGLFYILVAEPQATQVIMSRQSIYSSWWKELPKYPWMFVVMGGLVAVMVGVFYRRRNEGEGYQSLVAA